MRMRCYLCGALIAASVLEVLNGSIEHNACEVVHDCTASVEYGLPPQPHTPEYDDSDQWVLIRDGKAFREAGTSPETWVPINLRFDDAFEFRDEVLVQHK
jgi:hypothetical protein